MLGDYILRGYDQLPKANKYFCKGEMLAELEVIVPIKGKEEIN